MEYLLPKNRAQQIYVVAQMENDYLLHALKNLNLSYDTAAIIKYVNDHPGTRQKEIAEYINKQPASVTNMIKRLEKRLLLIRRVDPDNSREKQVFLLKDGLDMVTKIKQAEQDLDDLIDPYVQADGSVKIREFYQTLKQKLG
ncbi:MAG: MarR family transcriptional regulator [Lactobacillus sp.]|jgi:DNA-binding MarR family transcriptional regulator|nr:MarR family transcriptional regulator [Lactobacillus sp.]MCH3906370.1 MarR family transcriptional regulator [Lactobacillus sp.]MCH3990056.1 MarR family transcriptional regulator [Lactobacillus sp.]MCH4069230.1 MarR family transcriptional regulator [Lactobacillus sp.]MCI1303532.1 MarR family transcriptional regulator [Lactobacillus sp.]